MLNCVLKKCRTSAIIPKLQFKLQIHQNIAGFDFDLAWHLLDWLDLAWLTWPFSSFFFPIATYNMTLDGQRLDCHLSWQRRQHWWYQQHGNQRQMHISLLFVRHKLNIYQLSLIWHFRLLVNQSHQKRVRHIMVSKQVTLCDAWIKIIARSLPLPNETNVRHNSKHYCWKFLVIIGMMKKTTLEVQYLAISLYFNTAMEVVIALILAEIVLRLVPLVTGTMPPRWACFSGK